MGPFQISLSNERCVLLIYTRSQSNVAKNLETEFHEQMVNVYRNALTQAHYKATKFLEMVSMQGGLKAAKTLLHTSYLPDGFAELWQRGRLDLTMEHIVIQAPWNALFTEDELRVARERLAAHGGQVSQQ
jgi:hypothetical protein